MLHDQMDADYLQNELYRLGSISTKLRKKGICTHGWIQEKNNTVTCLHCNKKWNNKTSFKEELQEIKDLYF